ncbi:hypothetical protein FNH09_19010 [Streptomyces adustus]|uniref:Uncharacterized protein n=1 Tax=Streptomyces adustus TaxID=1609272 RepID=A0A5N8VGT2_9ACTN|nr:hypothetical protein [Streptomyces adustus]MPY33278.1 hypothetical protein [Streptomyces adustus]
MLIIETLQVVLTVAVLIVATGRQAANPLLLWTAVGFGTGQIVTALGGGLADAFFRLFVAAFAAVTLDKWRTERGVGIAVAGPAALLSGLLIGWAA